jgi:mono/diheme cytochrome c family protein
VSAIPSFYECALHSISLRKEVVQVSKIVVTWMGVALVGLGLLQAGGVESAHAAGRLQSASPVPPPAPVSQYRALLSQYCVTCHNERLHTAELLLDKMDVEKVGEGAPVWEKVIRKLRNGVMPPAGMPRPARSVTDSFVSYLETELNRAAEARPNPGKVGVHRLNRAEYANVVRDLLAVEINAEEILPTDDIAFGFDNIAGVLSVSPALLEKYLSAADKVSGLAIADQIPLDSKTYNRPEIIMEEGHEDRVADGLPFGVRGGMSVQHYFPSDGEYRIKVDLAKNGYGYFRGVFERHQLQVLLDRSRLRQFTVGEPRGRSKRFRAGDNPSAEADVEQDLYERFADKDLEVRVPVAAGSHVVGAAFLRDFTEAEKVLTPPMYGAEYFSYKGGNPEVQGITISGPYNAKKSAEAPSRRKVFVCYPASRADEGPCARKILATLARRAYRRPVVDRDVKVLFSFYEKGRSTGRFESGIQMALNRMLVEPEFLVRIERDPDGIAPDEAYRIGDLELASRLSFFLWSSIPDDELLGLAESGKLRNQAVLEQQVQRMLADSRSSALVDNFVGQWLYLRNSTLLKPDPVVFPNYDENLRAAFRRETELFFESIMREDRSAVDLLSADYTFLNERLARHYGIPNVYGSHFRRVKLQDEDRRGLLGQGTVLTATSYANRTSPVIRGKWLLENILGVTVPPPPMDVPSLTENGTDGKVLSIRERLAQHRTNPVCASCHRMMDPLGFALENFDAIGQWRTIDARTPIDPSGELLDGTKFQGPAGLREVFLNSSEQFVTTFTEKLLTYALGRGVEYYDQTAIRKIVREAAPSDYRWSALIVGIVNSTPFQMRQSVAPAATAGVR